MRSAVLPVFTLVNLAAFVLADDDALSSKSSPTPFSPGFNISAAIAQAISLPTHSWEYGTATEALLELYSAPYAIFGASPFPVPKLSTSPSSRAYSKGLDYAQQKIVLGAPPNAFSDGDGAVGDPASLGVAGIMLGGQYMDTAAAEVQYLLTGAPRWPNGAISHRADVAELWADFIYMAPPFLAYFAAATKNASVLRAAAEQCLLYRDVLLTNTSTLSLTPTPPATHPITSAGLWVHIIGPQSADPGIWSTGNGWAAAGTMRVLATIVKAPKDMFGAGPNKLTLAWKTKAIADLSASIRSILDSAIALQPSANDTTAGGLLRNYIDDPTWFGEISGSTLLASVAYRLVALSPSTSSPLAFPTAQRYINYAESIRLILGSGSGNETHITSDGIATPAVNPLGWGDRAPWTAGSPEGNDFVVLMYSAWRDWVQGGKRL